MVDEESCCKTAIDTKLSHEVCTNMKVDLMQVGQQACLRNVRYNGHFQLLWSEAAPDVEICTEGVQKLQYGCHLPH